jgi:hypothetical protein
MRIDFQPLDWLGDFTPARSESVYGQNHPNSPVFDAIPLKEQLAADAQQHGCRTYESCLSRRERE